MKLGVLLSILIILSVYSVTHVMKGSRSSLPKRKPRVIPHSTNVFLVVLVHLSGKNDRLEAITNTWMNPSFHSTVVFQTFGPGVSEPFAVTRQAFLHAQSQYPRAQFFAKFDDDSYVYVRELLLRLENQSASNYYAGYPMQDDRGFHWGSGGAGYILSHDVVSFLKDCQPKHSQYEDYAVAYCMKQNNITLTEMVGLHPDSPVQMLAWDVENSHPGDRFGRSEPIESYMYPVSYHYIRPSIMHLMHDNIYQSKSVQKRSQSIPHVLHQFWEGDENKRPELFMSSCKETHADWQYMLWNASFAQTAHPLGHFINQKFYQGELNLLSDVARYEMLLLYGGIYVDADSRCFRTTDLLLDEFVQETQGIGFLEKDLSYVNGLLASGVHATFPYSPLAVALVSGLRHTDWSQPAWISAGPMHFTKLVQRFNADASRPHLHVTQMPSYHVYPYHHSSARDLSVPWSVDMMRRGSVMDQQWGTTHSSYAKGQKWLFQETIRLEKLENMSKLDKTLEEYAELHALGLSTLAQRPRWLVCEFSWQAGNCNRMAHIVSCLMMAMATGRVLLFDWEERPSQMHENGKEQVSQAKFEDLFQQAPIDFSWKKAEEKFRGLEKHRLGDELLEKVRWFDLDTVYTESVITIHRYDWWGGPLFAKNPFYRDSVFHGLESSVLFEKLAKWLFRPKNRFPPKTCQNTLIHRRVHWERETALKEAFLKCAQHPKEYTLVTDQQACRNNWTCHTDAVQSMFQYHTCSGGAVLTAYSTFGACLANLGQIRPVIRVYPDGKCVQVEGDPLLEAGTLPHEERKVEKLVHATDKEDQVLVHEAYFIDASGMNDSGAKNIHKNLIDLPSKTTPIVLAVDDKQVWRHMLFLIENRVYLGKEFMDRFQVFTEIVYSNNT